MKITAAKIKSLLATRHRDDVYVSECKDGPTWGGGHLRLDGWAMRRSWTKPACIGYEIKVSRGDFVGDSKWPLYLPMCNELYFVAPKGVIDPAELSPDVGYIQVSSTGTRLFTKKKAPYRDIELPESMFRYLLMRATGFARELGSGPDREQRAEFWADWLESKQRMRDVGHRVSRRLSEIYTSDVVEVQLNQRRLERRLSGLESVGSLCDQLGVDPESYRPDWSVQNALSGLPSREVRRDIESAASRLNKLIETWSEAPEKESA